MSKKVFMGMTFGEARFIYTVLAKRDSIYWSKYWKDFGEDEKVIE